MSNTVISLIIAVLALLGFGAYKSKKLSEQKQKTREAEDKAEIRKKQMETVYEVRKELNLIEEEKEPEKTEPPAGGDSDSRLDRLSKLHKH